MNDLLLNIKGLKTFFNLTRGTLHAVDGVSLKVGAGEIVGLVGESGSGKSVLARSVLRLLQHPGYIAEGEIIYEGTDLTKLPEEKMREHRGKKIAMVFQDPLGYLNPVMKVGSQIEEALRIHRPNEDPKKIIPSLLESVGFPKTARIWDRYPHELSGGMLQRVIIALAISCDPKLLIADEPTTALDVTIQAQVLRLLKKLCKEREMAMLLITHNLGIVADTCDRIYVMYCGRIVETAEVFSLFENPYHPYTKGLLEATLSIDEFRENLTTIEGTVPDPINLPPGCRFAPRCPAARAVCTQGEPPCVTIDALKEHVAYCWIGTAEYEKSSSPVTTAN